VTSVSTARITATILRCRDGLPRVRDRVRRREPLRIAAFGSSITHDGYYLEPLGQALQTEYPGTAADIIVRALPGFGSSWAVFRTGTVAELQSDLVIVEFAVNDHVVRETDEIARSVEGIVRHLRAVPDPPDVLFAYFMSRLGDALERQPEIVDVWERVAKHYHIPTIDCSSLAEHLVREGRAIWLDRWPGRPSWEAQHPLALTRDLTHHTPRGGKVLGEHFAAAVIAAIAGTPGAAAAVLPAPLHGDHFAGARTLFPADIHAPGWSRYQLDDTQRSQPAVMYFSELLVPANAGCVLHLEFRGRRLNLWAHSGPGNILRLDGVAGPLDLPDPRIALPVLLLREARAAPHALEIDVRELPLQIAAVDIVADPAV
jgi:hypothetical protein